VIKKILFSIFLIFASTQVFAQNLNVYCEDDFPMQYKNNGVLTGFALEVVQEIQKRIGNHDVIQFVPWSRGMHKLNYDKNTFLFSMVKTPERENSYQWIGPIATVSYGLYVKSNSLIKVNHIDDAKKINSISVYRKDILDNKLTELGFENLDRAPSNDSGFKKLMKGRVDAYADAQIGVENVAIQAGYKIENVKLAFNLFKKSLFIAASQSTDPQIVGKWNEALESMKKDRTFYKIQKKYRQNLEPFSG
jgi:polar amino acid transport system substrate-binding protein